MRRRRAYGPEELALIERLYASGWTQAAIGQELGVGHRQVSKLMKRAGLRTRLYVGVGEKNGNWKGSGCGYDGFHFRVVRLRGRPSRCEFCQTTTAKVFDWANLTGRYEDPGDYVRLCRRCHSLMDDKGRHLRRGRRSGCGAAP